MSILAPDVIVPESDVPDLNCVAACCDGSAFALYAMARSAFALSVMDVGVGISYDFPNQSNQPTNLVKYI